MNLLGWIHRERAHSRLRAEHARLVEAHEQLQAAHAEAVEACEWFHQSACEQAARADEAEGRAIDAETVAGCLERQLDAERRKVAELEAIAGPHVPADDAPSPIYDQVTGEHPLPTFDTGETTVRLPPLSLHVALGGAA